MRFQFPKIIKVYYVIYQYLCKKKDIISKLKNIIKINVFRIFKLNKGQCYNR